MPTGITNCSLSPQGPSAQRQVAEKGPEGAWAPGGLSEDIPVFLQQEVLQLGEGGQRALDQLPGRKWLCPPSNNASHIECDGCSLPAPASFLPSRNHGAPRAVEAVPRPSVSSARGQQTRQRRGSEGHGQEGLSSGQQTTSLGGT